MIRISLRNLCIRFITLSYAGRVITTFFFLFLFDNKEQQKNVFNFFSCPRNKYRLYVVLHNLVLKGKPKKYAIFITLCNTHKRI